MADRGAGKDVTEQEGFLTLKGLLIAVAECIGKDPEPQGGPCIPEVLIEDEDGIPLVFYGVKGVFWNGDGGITIQVEVR